MSEEYNGGTVAALMAAERQKEQSVKQPSNQATKQPRLHEENKDILVNDNLEVIRSAVKRLGKETTSYRLHEKEKEALDDILYGLKKKGIRSSENEIVRIAINYIIDDFNTNKKASVLAEVLERLNA